jgi:hypothetical protein
MKVFSQSGQEKLCGIEVENMNVLQFYILRDMNPNQKYLATDFSWLPEFIPFSAHYKRLALQDLEKMGKVKSKNIKGKVFYSLVE